MKRRFLIVLALSLSTLACAEDFLVSGFNSDNVLRFSSAGAPIGGLTGITMNGPQATRIGPDGKLYVADEINNRILRFNVQTGAYIDTFVAAGLGGINGPTSMAWDLSGNLLVGSFNTDSIVKFGTNGQLIGTLVASGLGGLNGPDVGMTVGPDGHLYVPSFWNSRVLRYNLTTGAFIDTFVAAGSGGMQTPRTMVWRGGSMYVSDDFGSKVVKYDATTGAFQSVFVAAGSGGLNGASGMLFNSSGDLLVTSLGTNSVLRYNGVTGAFLGTFIGPGSGINGPTWIAAVPEPATMAVLGLGALVLARRRINSQQ